MNRVIKEYTKFLIVVVAICPLTVNIAAKPIKHYGRCKVGLEDGFCVRPTDCWEQNISIEQTRNRGKCSSSVVAHLVCCAKETSTQVPSLTTSSLVWNLPLPPLCGFGLTDYIIGGIEARITDFPWMVQLLYTTDDSYYEYRCGGTLISERWVVSAAHCVQNSLIASGYRVAKLRLGEWNTKRNPDCQVFKTGSVCAPPHVDMDIDRIIVHDDYNSITRNLPNDIALLRMASTVTYTEFIKPICLKSDQELRGNSEYSDVVMDIAGWGNTETTRHGSTIKFKTILRVWSNENCRNFMNNSNNGQLCAGGHTDASSCHGDSGGPLMYREDNNIGSKSYYLIGVISLGSANCSTRGQPVIFTKVENYIGWIIQNIAQNP